MSRIKVLDLHTANQIAAGEVVERPASIVKELMENSIDAGSTAITVEIRGGGMEYIRVTDNGSGILPEDALIAFSRHATSKIATSNDLEHIEILGFRGEALASIAAVARVTLTTRASSQEAGTRVLIEGGGVKENRPIGCPEGTTLEVANVFYNVPARLKFLKSARAEAGYISDYVSRMIMAEPSIAIKLVNNDRTVFQSVGDGNLKNAVYCVYGSDVLPELLPVKYDDGYLGIEGFAGSERIARNNRTFQSFYINSRYIKSQKLSYAIQRPYDTRLMTGRFPFAVLRLTLSSREIDVNVHPNKLDVRFKEEERVLRAVSAAIRAAIMGSRMPEIKADEAHISAAVPKTETEPLGETGPAASALFRTQPPRTSLQVSEALFSMKGLPQPPPSEAVQPARPKLDYAKYAELDKKASVGDKPLQRTLRPRTPQPDDLESPVEKTAQLDFAAAPYKIIGQLFGCYWLVQQGEYAYYIDQHAAHERRLYETLMEKGIAAASQGLLSPQVVRLTPQEYDTLFENMEQFTQLGFDVSEFGPLSVSVRAIPYILGQPQTEAFLHETLATLESKSRVTAAELKRDVLIRSACRHAVKAGAQLSQTEIAELLEAYSRDGTPLTCPHGRPVIIRLSRLELEKLFKRVL